MREQFEVSIGFVEKKRLKQKLQEVDIFWFRLAYQVDDSVLDERTRCKYLISPVTGIDHINEPLCKRFGITIISLRGELEFLKEVRATAEHTILLTLMLLRNAAPSIEDVKSFQWRRDLFRGFEIFKKKVGIVGYGRLGTIVSDYFYAMGAEVGYYDIVRKKAPSHYRRFLNLTECIAESDIVSIHIPYGKSTHHLFDATALNYFDSTKWLINTSRGGVVDEDALLEILKEGQIAGAALDVLYGEPDVTHHPLLNYARRCRNLIITPHIGGCTFESFEKTESFVADKLLKQVEIN